MKKLTGQNIHTIWISEGLGVTVPVALKVQDQLNNFYHLDWSEEDMETIHAYARLAFEDLNQLHQI